VKSVNLQLDDAFERQALLKRGESLLDQPRRRPTEFVS